jgi:hypothetical protein
MVPERPHQNASGIQDLPGNHSFSNGQAFVFLIGNTVLLFMKKDISYRQATGPSQKSSMGREETESNAPFHAFPQKCRTGALISEVKDVFQINQGNLGHLFLSLPGFDISIFEGQVQVLRCDKEGIQKFSHRSSPPFSMFSR